MPKTGATAMSVRFVGWPAAIPLSYTSLLLTPHHGFPSLSRRSTRRYEGSWKSSVARWPRKEPVFMHLSQVAMLIVSTFRLLAPLVWIAPRSLIIWMSYDTLRYDTQLLLDTYDHARSYSIPVLSRSCSTLAIIRHHPSSNLSSFVRLCRLKNPLRSAVIIA
jgi:hypothetical protein